MKSKKQQTAVYDDRVNATLTGLIEGKTREELAESFGLNTWKSLDIYMRRKGFIWDRSNSIYIPAVNKVDQIMGGLGRTLPAKAEMIITRFEEMNDNSDPRTIAREFGFSDHWDLGEYMESKGLLWDSEKKNYGVMFEDSSGVPNEKVGTINNKTIQQVRNREADSEVSLELKAYLPILDILIKNKDRLISLLMLESSGMIPRYTITGTPKTQSCCISDLLSRLMKEFCESKNIKQREVMEGALIEYFSRYGYQREVDKLFQKK